LGIGEIKEMNTVLEDELSLLFPIKVSGIRVAKIYFIEGENVDVTNSWYVIYHIV
jgi:hypothetical protein